MAGLFASLSMAARSLEAQRAGLDVAGQNIANLNTPGYTRRRLALAEVVNGTGGVEVQGTRALRDRVLDGRVRTAIPDESREGAIKDTLALVETAIGAPGQGLDGQLAAYFDAFAALSLDPTSTVARDGVIQQGRQLATAFNATAARLADSVRVADNGVRDSAVQVNALAKQIAALNDAIAAANGVDVDALKDRQNLALEELSGLTQVAVLSRSDGGVDVTIPSGRALVIGGSPYGVTVGTSPGGLATLSLGGADITAEITNGKIGGLLHARDTQIPAYQTKLDELAYGVATEVNTLHQGGFDLNGNAGAAFFTPPAAVAGAAAAFSVSAALIGNPSLVAASQSGAPGDNQVAKALAALRNQPVLNGGTATFNEGWAELAYAVGSDADAARAEQGSRQDVLGQVQRLRDQVSGVSLDEEAASMMKFQRAYEANAKYFSAVDSMLLTLMRAVGGV
ncbi:MAG TPA: flagellar hook-associated protein FlgK [Vicinamibacterales bacterium]|nr:flagellar hook-associated protein FlgK [Vicinamibacterales bacterium]